MDELGLCREFASRRAIARRGDHRTLDVEAGDMAGTVPLDQVQRDAAGAAANVEDALAGKIEPGNHAVDLLRASGRQITFAPQRLEETDRRVVVFGRICRGCAHWSFRLPFLVPRKT